MKKKTPKTKTSNSRFGDMPSFDELVSTAQKLYPRPWEFPLSEALQVHTFGYRGAGVRPCDREFVLQIIDEHFERVIGLDPVGRLCLAVWCALKSSGPDWRSDLQSALENFILDTNAPADIGKKRRASRR